MQRLRNVRRNVRKLKVASLFRKKERARVPLEQPVEILFDEQLLSLQESLSEKDHRLAQCEQLLAQTLAETDRLAQTQQVHIQMLHRINEQNAGKIASDRDQHLKQLQTMDERTEELYAIINDMSQSLEYYRNDASRTSWTAKEVESSVTAENEDADDQEADDQEAPSEPVQEQVHLCLPVALSFNSSSTTNSVPEVKPVPPVDAEHETPVTQQEEIPLNLPVALPCPSTCEQAIQHQGCPLEQLLDNALGGPVNLFTFFSQFDANIVSQLAPYAMSMLNTQPLGEGGQGAVFKVMNIITREELAMKVMKKCHEQSPEGLFQKWNLKTQQSLMGRDLPGLVTLNEVVVGDQYIVTVQRLVCGVTLSQLLDQGYCTSPGDVTMQDLVRCVESLTRSINVLHSDFRMVHNDLKPPNIIIEADTLMPFIIDCDLLFSSGVKIGSCGTEDYMSEFMKSFGVAASVNDHHAMQVIINEIDVSWREDDRSVRSKLRYLHDYFYDKVEDFNTRLQQLF